MQTLTHNVSLETSRANHAEAASNLLKSFITWAGNQEKNRFLWAGISILGHGAFFTIVTLLVVVFTGNALAGWVFAAISMAMVLVVNLSALPTKITIPVLLFSLVIDVAVMGAAIVCR